MKKIIAIVALALGFAASANAQFGVIGGFTSSHTNIKGVDWISEAKNANVWHAGIAYKFEIGPFFTIQPALVYQTKGLEVKDNLRTLTSNGGFVELELGAQLGIDLVAVRPYFLLEPFIGYQVYGKDAVEVASVTDINSLNNYVNSAKNKLEGGFGVGAGIEIVGHVQLSVQWFMNVGKLYNGDKLAAEAAWNAATSGYKDINNYQGIKITAGIFF